MYSIEKLRLNKFVAVHIPRGADLFSRIVPQESPINGVESPDDVIPMNQRVIDQLEYMDAYDSFQSEIERQNKSVDDSSVNQHQKNDDSSGE